MVEFRHVRLPGGRLLEYAQSGPTEGPVLLFHHGTPGCGRPFEHVARPALERGLRLVTSSRPGYATSTRCPGRSVADVVADSFAVLDAVGADSAYVAGVSGGGPHALACAALAPDRFRAALVIAGVAPFDADGLEFLAGMGEANIVEFTATLAGEPALRSLLDAEAPDFRDGTGEDIIKVWHTMLAAADQAVLTGDLGADFGASMHHALSGTVDGWIDDNMAFVAPWRFGVSDIGIPTTLWHGEADLMVPFSHGEWLAGHIPGAKVHLEPGEGHLSLRVARMADMLDDLLSLA